MTNDEFIAYIEKAIFDERFAFVSDLKQAQDVLDKNPSLRLIMMWDDLGELTYILPEHNMIAKASGPNGPVEPGVTYD